MSSRSILLWGVVFFALLISSPTAAPRNVCYYANTLSFPTSCSWLELYNNNLKTLNLSAINFTGLTGISLGFNELIEVPRLSASAKATLQQLWLPHNKIAFIPADYFNDFRSLIDLNLASNKLTGMPRLSSASRLKKFHAYENKISAIPAGYFNGFSELSFLTLERNKISRFPAGTSLRHLSKLNELWIDQMDCSDCATLRVLQQIAAMNVSHRQIYSTREKEYRNNFPCSGDLSGTTLQEMRSKTCSKNATKVATSGLGRTGSPSTTAPPSANVKKVATAPPSANVKKMATAPPSANVKKMATAPPSVNAEKAATAPPSAIVPTALILAVVVLAIWS